MDIYASDEEKSEAIKQWWRENGLAVAAGVAAVTGKGRQFLTFAKESRTEVRKVVWPTRQEATQTTLIIAVATAIIALLLWGMDAILVRIVGFLTGLEF